MTEITFGEVVTATLDEIGATTTELSWEERKDPDAAMKHYQRNVADRLRRLFDQVEARIEREEKEEAARVQRREEREHSKVIQVIKDLIKNDPDVQSALVKCIEGGAN